MGTIKENCADQFKVVDLDESNIELVTVVGHLLQPLQHRAARLVARV